MLFNFRLIPIEETAPWGSKNELTLHWFGLADACYWLTPGDSELFRYEKQFIDRQGWSHDCLPDVPCYVVRLWEDLIDILPSVLVPVPQALAEKIEARNLLSWRSRAIDWYIAREDSQSDDIMIQAIEWLDERRLPTGHLQWGPQIWFWNDGTHVHIEWDNRECQEDGIPVWTAQLGSWALPVQEFMEELQAFDRELIDAMRIRVDQIAANWTRSDVAVDMPGLKLEQARRSTWLAKALEQAKAKQEQLSNWDTICKAVALIESDL